MNSLAAVILGDFIVGALLDPLGIQLLGARQIFYPTVYDSMTIVRPSISFREGITVANCMTYFHAFILDIPYMETYLLAATHLIPIVYGSNLQILTDMEWTEIGHSFGIFEETYSRTERALLPNHRIDLILGFTTLYLLVRMYVNSLVAEVSQQMYGGTLRCISLGVTRKYIWRETSNNLCIYIETRGLKVMLGNWFLAAVFK